MPSAATVPAEETHPRDTLKAERAHLFAQLNQHANTQRLVTKLARAIDHTLVRLWQKEQVSITCALIIVGGYGRGELFPYFDMSILLLLPGITDKALGARLKVLIGRYWNVGLDTGSSVRTIDECVKGAAQGVTACTSLLGACLLTGDGELCRTLETHY